jgi:hypothetical protein
VATPEAIGAIGDRLRHGVSNVQHLSVQALVELTKFGKVVLESIG